jgi:hypothetical protein
MFTGYQSENVYRTQDIQSPFSPSYDFKPFPEPEVNLNLEKFEDENGELDEIMEEKLEIIEKRPVKGKGKKKAKPSRLPGQKLMKKLHKQQQIEKSLGRVIKNIVQ